MREEGMGSDAYLDAFMQGFEFVLLAMRGRIAEGTLAEEDRLRLEAFLADYQRISRAYRERREDAAAAHAFPASRAFRVELTALLAN